MLTVKIGTDNAAFGETEQEKREELSRILVGLADKLRGGGEPGVLYDTNGNRVGFAELG